MAFIVAIDGPAGSGKGTVTKIISERMGLVNVDTGAMYRCVTLDCLEKNIKSNELDKIAKLLENIEIKFEKNDNDENIVLLNNVDVTKEIRSPEVNANVSE